MREEPPAFLCAIAIYSERIRLADRQDAQERKLLAVAVLATVVVATTLLENDDLLALRLRDDLGGNRYVSDVSDCAILARKQDIAQRDRLASFTSQLFDGDLVSGGDPILLTAGAHYCEHGALTQSKNVPEWAETTCPGRGGSCWRILVRATRRTSHADMGDQKNGAVSPSTGLSQRAALPHKPRNARRLPLARRNRRAMMPDMIRLNVSKTASLLLLASAGLLQGCAASSGYPSLAVRPIERIAGSASAVTGANETIPDLPPASTDLTIRLAGLVDAARKAHASFQAKQPAAERAIAVSGAKLSDSWTSAEVALSGLQISRSGALTSLAELDQLFVDERAAHPEQLSPAAATIAQARDQVAAWVDAETVVISRLSARLN